MKQMVKAEPGFGSKMVGFCRSTAGKVTAGVAAMFGGMHAALAQSALGTAAAAQVANVEDDVNGVLVVLVVVVFLLVAWAYLKRAK